MNGVRDQVATREMSASPTAIATDAVTMANAASSV